MNSLQSEHTMRSYGQMPLILFCIAMAFGSFSCGSSGSKKQNTVTVQKRTITQDLVFNAKILPYNASGGYSSMPGMVAAVRKTPGSIVRKDEVIVEIRTINNELYPVRATANGMLLAVYFSEGEYVGMNSSSQSANLFTIGDTGKKIIVADLDEIDARKIRMDQVFTVQVTDSVSLPGAVNYINSMGNEIDGTVRFRLSGSVDDPLNVIRLLSVSFPVRVQFGRAVNVLSVERGAIVTRGSNHFVRVSDGNGIREKPISIGIDDGNYVQINSGVIENEVVLVE